MKIIYNNDGSIKFLELDKFIQQGNDNIQKVFVAVEGLTAEDFSMSANFRLPNDDIVSVPTTETHEETIDGTTYNGRIVPITASVTIYAGQVDMSLILKKDGATLYTYQAKLTINPTPFEPDEQAISQAQWNALQEQLNTYQIKFALGNVRHYATLESANADLSNIATNQIALVGTSDQLKIYEKVDGELVEGNLALLTAALIELQGKQNRLVAGNNIFIDSNNVISASGQLTIRGPYESYEELDEPSAATTGAIYLVEIETPEEKNYYEEYVTVYHDDTDTYTWELFGTTKVDLSDYALKTDVEKRVPIVFITSSKLTGKQWLQCVNGASVRNTDIDSPWINLGGQVLQNVFINIYNTSGTTYKGYALGTSTDSDLVLLSITISGVTDTDTEISATATNVSKLGEIVVVSKEDYDDTYAPISAIKIGNTYYKLIPQGNDSCTSEQAGYENLVIGKGASQSDSRTNGALVIGTSASANISSGVYKESPTVIGIGARSDKPWSVALGGNTWVLSNANGGIAIGYGVHVRVKGWVCFDIDTDRYIDAMGAEVKNKTISLLNPSKIFFRYSDVNSNTTQAQYTNGKTMQQILDDINARIPSSPIVSRYEHNIRLYATTNTFESAELYIRLVDTTSTEYTSSDKATIQTAIATLTNNGAKLYAASGTYRASASGTEEIISSVGYSTATGNIGILVHHTNESNPLLLNLNDARISIVSLTDIVVQVC